MTGCPDQQMLLQGLLDGELDAANALACEAHLRGCDACNAEFQRLQMLKEAVAAPGVAYRAPEGLRRRIEALAAGGASRPPRRSASAWAAGAITAIAAALAMVVILPQVADSGVERQLVASHVRSLLANHLTDVATSNQHVVRPWFNGRVDFAPPVPELADRGFPLVGGRLDYIKGRVVPAIVYHRRLHTINLFVWPAGPAAPGPVRTARRDGYSLVEWTQGGLRMSAVSDIDAGELQQFRQAFAERSPR